MMDKFWNQVKAHATALDGMNGQARFGLVASFDPNAYSARVLVQPENLLSGWLPVLGQWVGAGWGMAAPLSPGDQVLLLAQEGDAEQAVVLGRVWSSVDPPPQVPSGEFWLLHQAGSFIKLMNDGSITLQAATVTVTGNLTVTGEISDLNGKHGSLDILRQTYDRHAHQDPQSGVTSPPLETV
jgi:phage baseplate assembly protein gpV